MGDATLLDPAMEQQLGTALKSAAQFGRQTMQRVDAMKRTVLQAFEREERVDAPAPKAHGQYHKDINAKIVALVQGRAEAVEQFMSNQESAELTLSSLRRRLATMRGCVVRAAAHACACVRVCEQLINSVSKDYPASHHSVTDILVIAINVMQC